MRDDLPFPAAPSSIPCGRASARRDTQPSPPGAHEFSLLAFEASCSAVADSFPHLAVDDIAYPPPDWPDAKAAQQIALHLAIRELQARQAVLAEQLDRGRSQIARALKIVGERMEAPEFERAYRAMAENAKHSLEDKA
ncbi:MAG: hypothetical protein R3D34_17560 [Nitratireductor sp.]